MGMPAMRLQGLARRLNVRSLEWQSAPPASLPELRPNVAEDVRNSSRFAQIATRAAFS